MSAWEPSIGETSEWYTPVYIFDALGEIFDLDVSAPPGGGPHVPARAWFTQRDDWADSSMAWDGLDEPALRGPQWSGAVAGRFFGRETVSP